MEYVKKESETSFLLSSAISTAITTTFTAPLERIKILLQTEHISKISQKQKLGGFLSGISSKNTYNKDNGVLSIKGRIKIILNREDYKLKKSL
jgi:hypothetical protein